ncbi:MAG: CHRD domain-containing protein [Woeseiaceae bacterium]
MGDCRVGSIQMGRTYSTCLTLVAVLLTPIAANADIILLEAPIDGPQAGAGMGTGSTSMALAEMSYDDITMTLIWSISEVTPFFNSDVNFAHFHGPATPMQNAAVQVWICDNLGAGPAGTPLCGGPGESFASGSSVLSVSQAEGLLAGLWYINTHTRGFPPGEIRGQVTRVPEPGTLALLGIGLLFLSITRRKTT